VRPWADFLGRVKQSWSCSRSEELGRPRIDGLVELLRVFPRSVHQQMGLIDQGVIDGRGGPMSPLEMNFVAASTAGSRPRSSGISLREAATRVILQCQR